MSASDTKKAYIGWLFECLHAMSIAELQEGAQIDTSPGSRFSKLGIGVRDLCGGRRSWSIQKEIDALPYGSKRLEALTQEKAASVAAESKPSLWCADGYVDGEIQVRAFLSHDDRGWWAKRHKEPT